jgi:hypothetical protein
VPGDDPLERAGVDQLRVADGELDAVVAQAAIFATLVSKSPLNATAWKAAAWVESTMLSFMLVA